MTDPYKLKAELTRERESYRKDIELRLNYINQLESELKTACQCPSESLVAKVNHVEDEYGKYQPAWDCVTVTCPTCERKVTIGKKELEKYADGDRTKLSDIMRMSFKELDKLSG